MLFTSVKYASRANDIILFQVVQSETFVFFVEYSDSNFFIGALKNGSIKNEKNANTNISGKIQY